MSKQLEIVPAQQAAPTSIQILEAIVRGGVNSENVAVVREILQMRREEEKAKSKSAFNRAFFELRSEISGLNFYADKAAKDRAGNTTYTYCSETEIASKLEPVLFKHGFAMLFGQRQTATEITVQVTLSHVEGHDEVREYSVRPGGTNAMKDATAADTGATTSAWRHLVIKLFGLKSRICAENDARNIGDPNEFVSKAQADELERRVAETNSDRARFLKTAGATKFSEIPASKYAMLDAALRQKEKGR